MNEIVISIILPVYNVEKYIYDCAISIVNQSLKKFEVVVVNDGSIDNSIRIVSEVFDKYNINYRIINRINGGLSSARNTGVENAKGDYFVFVDSDDVISNEYLNTLYNDIISNDVELSIGYFKRVKEKDKFIFDTSNTIGKIVNKKKFLNLVLKHKITTYFGCFMIGRKLFERLKLKFDEDVYFGVDQCIMWRLITLTEKYTFNNKQIYNYYLRPNSIMTGQKLNKIINNMPAFERCVEDLKNNIYFNSKNIIIRQKIAGLHTVAKRFKFTEFNQCYEKYDLHTIDILKFPDIKIKFIGVVYLFGKFVFYNVLKRI